MGSDILLLDISELTLIADYFIIATADSDRQLKAISTEVTAHLKKEYDMSPLSVEAAGASGWMLLDYGAVVVHLFTPKRRDYYQLEELWEDGRTIVRIA